MGKIRGLAVVVALALASSGGAHGAEVKRGLNGFVGGLLGASAVNEGVGTGVGFGLNGGYFFSGAFGMGALLRASNHGRDVSSFFLALQGLFRFADVLPGLYLGASLGSGKFTFLDQEGNTALAYGAKAAFDYPISRDQDVTIGIDLDVMFTEPGVSLLSVFSPMLTAKWWF
jgi:hypothetical protein